MAEVDSPVSPVNNLPIRTLQGMHSANSGIPRHLGIVLFGALPVIYFASASILTQYADLPMMRMSLVGLAFACVLLLFLKRQKVNFLAFLFLATLWLSAFTSSRMDVSVWKAAAFTLVFTTSGPIVESEAMRIFRREQWKLTILLIFVSGGFSLAAVFHPLQQSTFAGLGFPGIFTHSMIQSPIAGLGVVTCVAYFASSGRLIALIPAALFTYLLMLGGSRLALVAAIAAVLVVLVAMPGKTRRAISLALLCLACLAVSAATGEYLTQYLEAAPDALTTLQYKALNDTRSAMWNMRLQEALDSPLTGTGVGNSSDLSDVTGENWKMHVEPGSSYLGAFAMTGLLGVLASALLLGQVLVRALRLRRTEGSPMVMILVGYLAFLFVHMIAEGWILAPGSLVFFIFWLCCARVNDMWGEASQNGNQPAATSMVRR